MLEKISIQTIFSILVVVLLVLIIYYLINIGNNFVNRENKIHINTKSLSKIILWVAIIVLLVILFARFPILGDMVATIIVALILAYILNPLVDKLNQRLPSRAISILAIYVIIVGVLVILGIIVLPQIIEEAKKFFVSLPWLIEEIIRTINELTTNLTNNNAMINDVIKSLSSEITNKLNDLQSAVINGVTSITRFVSSFFSKLLKLILVPVVSFYFLKDKDKILETIRKNIPESKKQGFYEVAGDIDTTLSQFIRGRLVMAVFVGLATTVMLLILGIDFAVIIGLITCIADIIPYIGPFLGFLPAFVLAFFQEPIKAVWVGLIFVFIQWIENNILGPKILGNSTGLHPLLVLLCLLIGGGMFGVPGMILSVPIVAVVRILYLKFIPIIKIVFTDHGSQIDKE